MRVFRSIFHFGLTMNSRPHFFTDDLNAHVYIFGIAPQTNSHSVHSRRLHLVGERVIGMYMFFLF